MNSLEYAINSLAWTLGGVVITLTYQRIANWYRERNDMGQLPPISTTTYFGSLIVMISVIAALFSYSGKLAARENKICQDKVNQSNVIVLNRLIDSIYGKDGFVPNIDALKAKEQLLLENKRTLKQIVSDFNSFFGKQKILLNDLNTNRLIPISTCNNGNVPPNLNKPDSIPSPSK